MRSAITDKLFGYTGVNRLEFVFDPSYSVCNLCLELEHPLNGKTIGVIFKSVSHLRIRDFGGGLTQVLHLTVEDVKELQLDRVAYHVKEIERDMLECSCVNIQLIDNPATNWTTSLRM